MATTSRRDNPRRPGPGAGKGPQGLPNPFNRGFQNPFNRGNNEGGGRLRASRNAVRQALLREGRRKGALGADVRAVDGQADSDWGAMFEFDPDLVAAFDKNMRFFKHMFSVDNVLAPLPTPLRRSLSRNFGLFTRVFTQFVDRRETRNLRASIPGLAQLQEIADETEHERMQEFRKKHLDAMAKAKAEADKNRKKAAAAK
ncbi:hypothetical protein KFL_004300100 [Klebsormidium nitens]|uniref:Uncharacterized protein n=1 Tax=Klebsormidium nitens TaxID=105231 RepID=A0A1Y1IG29_KLENI|nr:hypothetical protein KFL_004300100 [Klebsormidium nitens]|eukprot:GAQ88459.1 hypothetical protein KFL_004300100 [Klebsormidium nitens]